MTKPKTFRQIKLRKVKNDDNSCPENFPFSYLQETSENHRFSDVFRGHDKEPLA